MKKWKKIFLVSLLSVALLAVFSWELFIRQKYIERLVNSEYPDRRCYGYSLLNNNDTVFIKRIFTQPIDHKTSFGIRFYGRTVYQNQMLVLEKISGLHSPDSITYQVDTIIYQFYKKWAEKNGYLK